MCPTTSRPEEAQEPLFCLQCTKPVILYSALVLEVSDDGGVFLGYLHKNCLPEWEQRNSGSVIQPLTKT